MPADDDTCRLDPVYAIVLNWNLPDDTLACVRSLQASVRPARRIIVVDNASTDDSVRRFQCAFGDAVQVLRLPTNRGFAGGMNAGIQAALDAGAESVLLLNNDTVVAPSMLLRLRETAAQSPLAGIVGPAIYYFDAPQRLWQIGARRRPLLPIPLNLGAAALRRAGNRPLRVDYITGCAMFIRREVFIRIGLFDTDYVMYYEDADFCARARAAGFEILVAPHARMWHRVSRSARKVQAISRYLAAWGRARFYRQHPHGPLPGLTFAYLLTQAALRATLDAARGAPELALSRWRGTIDGYALRPSRVPLPGSEAVRAW